jgi:hypothetical protein
MAFLSMKQAVDKKTCHFLTTLDKLALIGTKGSQFYGRKYSNSVVPQIWHPSTQDIADGVGTLYLHQTCHEFLCPANSDQRL